MAKRAYQYCRDCTNYLPAISANFVTKRVYEKSSLHPSIIPSKYQDRFRQLDTTNFNFFFQKNIHNISFDRTFFSSRYYIISIQQPWLNTHDLTRKKERKKKGNKEVNESDEIGGGGEKKKKSNHKTCRH